MRITKDLSLIMKCYAILFIALHNFIHQDRFGFVQENETTFDVYRTQCFIDRFLNPSISIIFDLFSFIGWFGVPVFVFISGYGLINKYEQGNLGLDIKSYIGYNYLKLLNLLLPAFIISLCLNANIPCLQFLKYFFSLTFLETLFNGTFVSLPSAFPAFWYFGLTFQLYLLYIIINKTSNKKYIFLLFSIFLLIQLLLGLDYPEHEKWLRYIKLNLFGWIPVFLLGILAGGSKIDTVARPVLKWLWPIFFVATIVMNLNYYSWIIMPFLAILFFYSLSLFVDYIGGTIRKISLRVGKMSAYIFCSHSITIAIFQRMNLQASFLVLLFAYIVSFFVIAMVYKQIVSRIDLQNRLSFLNNIK